MARANTTPNPFCRSCAGYGYTIVYAVDGNGDELGHTKTCQRCERCRLCGCYPKAYMGPRQLCDDCAGRTTTWEPGAPSTLH